MRGGLGLAGVKEEATVGHVRWARPPVDGISEVALEVNPGMVR